MGAKTVSVIIPTRLQGCHLDRAIRSVLAQEGIAQADIQIIVGVDNGHGVPFKRRYPALEMAESRGHSQARALNAAIQQARGVYLAFLEDDDVWERTFLRTALTLLDQAGFVSSNQLEVNERGSVQQINDFPTPSGWILRRKTFNTVGPFDETYRWHIDNEWLGRLGEANITRSHLVESTAPIAPHLMSQLRPKLAKLLCFGRPQPRIIRHEYSVPMISRLVHSGSAMYRIAQDPALKAESDDEKARVRKRFGHIPW
jgi:glycosyltransferase involved in cell wall biosynthesis